MIPHLIVPGWGDSGPDHWQTAWERELGAPRVRLADWLDPRRAVWVAALDAAIAELARRDPRPPVLVAHSLGCIAIAHWVHGVSGGRTPIRAALLVAPADVEQAACAADLVDFAPVPAAPLPFPSLVVTSDDDPYVSVERAAVLAAAWGSELHAIPRAGHLNAASGLGRWADGRALLARLLGEPAPGRAAAAR